MACAGKASAATVYKAASKYKKLLFLYISITPLLVITGLFLLISENIAKKVLNKKELNMKNSILIAIAQGFAALPGFSRSGLTIATGLLAGMDRVVAAKYSFLLSIPIILGSSMFYPLLELDLKEIVNYNWYAIIIGTIISGIVGYLCIKYFLKFVGKFSLAVFGYYCLIIGLFSFIFFI